MCNIRLSHVTFESNQSHTYSVALRLQICHIDNIRADHMRMSHVTFESNQSHTCSVALLLRLCRIDNVRADHMRMSHVTYESVMSHTYRRGRYGVAATSSLLKITGLFCKRDPSNRRYSAKKTYNFKEPTKRSHPISD